MLREPSVYTYECQVCRWKKNMRTQRNRPTFTGAELTHCPQCRNEKINFYKRKPRLERWLEGL